MNQQEDPRIADARLRDLYIRLGIVIPYEGDWLEEMEEARNTRDRRPQNGRSRFFRNSTDRSNGRA